MTQEQIINLIEESLDGQGSQVDSGEKLATIMKEINGLGNSYEYTKLSVGTTTFDEDFYSYHTPITTSQAEINALLDDMDAGKNVFVGVLINGETEEAGADRQLTIYCNRIGEERQATEGSDWYCLHTSTSEDYMSGSVGSSELSLSRVANQSEIITYWA